MRKERASDVVRKNLSVLYSTLKMEKEVSLALSEALQIEIHKNNILTEQLESLKPRLSGQTPT